MKKTDLLVYTGGASERAVSAAEWRAAGVENQEGVVWSARNNHSVEVGDLSKQALEVLLAAHEGEFRVATTTESENTAAPANQKETAR